MAGLGLGVEIAAIRRVGPKVGLAVCGSLAFLIALSLTLILGLRIVGSPDFARLIVSTR